MKRFKHVFTVVFVLCMVFSLYACGGTGSGEETTAQVPDTTEATTPEAERTTVAEDDGKVAYKVSVVDEAGNPIAGALVQMCLDVCFPSATNESGVAEFSLVEGNYKVTFLTLPTGYTYSGEVQEFYFEDGSTEMTITLKAAQ